MKVDIGAFLMVTVAPLAFRYLLRQRARVATLPGLSLHDPDSPAAERLASDAEHAGAAS